MGAQTVMKQVFNGTTGYQMQMGKKADLSPEDIADAKADKGLFNQLNYATDGSKLESAGVTSVGTASDYKLLVTSASGQKKTQYYDVKSGLLIREESTTKKQGTEISQTFDFSDYKKVGDVLFPHKIIQAMQTPMGSQELIITIKEIKLNPALQASDFN
jgi:hypothetical protein